MSEEHDAFTEPGSSEPLEEPLAPDRLLSLVCGLWLLNSAIGARVAVKEELPAEWVGGLYVGRDASAEFFKGAGTALDRKSTRLNSSHANISYAVFCLKK